MLEIWGIFISYLEVQVMLTLRYVPLYTKHNMPCSLNEQLKEVPFLKSIPSQSWNKLCRVALNINQYSDRVVTVFIYADNILGCSGYTLSYSFATPCAETCGISKPCDFFFFFFPEKLEMGLPSPAEYSCRRVALCVFFHLYLCARILSAENSKFACAANGRILGEHNNME